MPAKNSEKPKDPPSALPEETMVQPEITPANEPSVNGVSETTAEELVMADKDSFPTEAATEAPGVITNAPDKAEDPPTPPLTPEEKQSGRGRPVAPPSDDPKVNARREKERERDRARKLGSKRPAPDFSDVNGKASAPPPASDAAAVSVGVQTGGGTAKPVDYRALAEVCFGLGSGLAVQWLGPEWSPQSEDEKNGVVIPLAVWLQSKQMPDLPPGVVVGLAVAFYASKRIHQKPTKDKLTLFWLWAKSKLSRRKKQKVAPVADRSAKVDTEPEDAP